MRLLAIDQGTTSTKAYLWEDGALRFAGRRVQAQIRPHAGWVEHDANELAAHVAALVAEAGPVAAMGLANQGETVVAWHARTREPLYHAIVWQDERTADEVARLRAAGVEALTLARAGLPLDAYFSATKLRWLLDHTPGAQTLAAQGMLRLGTSDAFLLDRLTGRCVTDVSTASRTSLMNLRTLEWDAELCAAFGVPMACLPDILPTTGDFGTLPGGARVTASVVDQQASLFGHGCTRPGDMKITFGTGAFALGVTGDAPAAAEGLLPTVAWQLRGAAPVYALDGGILTAGATLEWLREIGVIGGIAALDGLAGEPVLARGLAFVPALAGLGCPHWDRGARGTWLGLGLGTTQDELARAVLEGIALRAAEVVAAFGTDGTVAIDGGISRNGYFTRFLAAALGRPVRVAAEADVTALGVLRLCLAAAGESPDLLPVAGEVVEAPALPAALHARFAEAVALSRSWGQAA